MGSPPSIIFLVISKYWSVGSVLGRISAVARVGGFAPRTGQRIPAVDHVSHCKNNQIERFLGAARPVITPCWRSPVATMTASLTNCLYDRRSNEPLTAAVVLSCGRQPDRAPYRAPGPPTGGSRWYSADRGFRGGREPTVRSDRRPGPDCAARSGPA